MKFGITEAKAYKHAGVNEKDVGEGENLGGKTIMKYRRKK